MMVFLLYILAIFSSSQQKTNIGVAYVYEKDELLKYLKNNNETASSINNENPYWNTEKEKSDIIDSFHSKYQQMVEINLSNDKYKFGEHFIKFLNQVTNEEVQISIFKFISDTKICIFINDVLKINTEYSVKLSNISFSILISNKSSWPFGINYYFGSVYDNNATELANQIHDYDTTSQPSFIQNLNKINTFIDKKALKYNNAINKILNITNTIKSHKNSQNEVNYKKFGDVNDSVAYNDVVLTEYEEIHEDTSEYNQLISKSTNNPTISKISNSLKKIKMSMAL
ncbi:hypothetical protein TCON_1142 [Astathelohania contejeani]|uniref:Uncharacterized protein n=1 Tax=Astathelohania contejeani TaxID=164912 RepID=A0ABQ7HZU5_9MICR|nr:hypothetical protein TCON_1142 [Thelohania contejeani]